VEEELHQMAPQAKVKSNAGSASSPAKLTDAEKIKRLETEIVALQRQLDQSAHEVQATRSALRASRMQCESLQTKLESQRTDHADIIESLARKHEVLGLQCHVIVQHIATTEQRRHWSVTAGCNARM
jgi:predicted  nucleic acid-binding Zn-ribbon protein